MCVRASEHICVCVHLWFVKFTDANTCPNCILLCTQYAHTFQFSGTTSDDRNSSYRKKQRVLNLTSTSASLYTAGVDTGILPPMDAELFLNITSESQNTCTYIHNKNWCKYVHLCVHARVYCCICVCYVCSVCDICVLCMCIFWWLNEVIRHSFWSG